MLHSILELEKVASWSLMLSFLQKQWTDFYHCPYKSVVNPREAFPLKNLLPGTSEHSAWSTAPRPSLAAAWHAAGAVSDLEDGAGAAALHSDGKLWCKSEITKWA